MDIAAILAEADEEVAYDDDEFEKLASPTKHGESVPILVSDILKTSAKVVQKEELEEVDRVLNNSSTFIRNELDAASNNDHHDIDKDDRNTLNALLDGEKEVEELTSPRGNRVQISSLEKAESESDPDEDEDDDVNRDPNLCKELIYACHNGKMNQVENLLRKNVNVAFEDRHGWTAFHWTASKGYLDIMEALITHVRNRGKNIKLYLHKQDRLAGWTPLHVSLYSKYCLWISTPFNIVRLQQYVVRYALRSYF